MIGVESSQLIELQQLCCDKELPGLCSMPPRHQQRYPLSPTVQLGHTTVKLALQSCLGLILTPGSHNPHLYNYLLVELVPSLNMLDSFITLYVHIQSYRLYHCLSQSQLTHAIV